MRNIYFFFVTLLLLSLASCSNDKEELLYPSGVCDTSMVKYSLTIAPILTTSCFPCHTGNFPAANVRLDNYNDARILALNGKMYGSITHAAGFIPMPQSAPKLPDCTIRKIKKWIDDGAPNN